MKKDYLKADDFLIDEDTFKINKGNHFIYFKPICQNVNMDTPIYRYTKLRYLISMLDNNQLFIPNRNSFTDLRDKQGIDKYLPPKGVKFSHFTPVPSYNDKLRKNKIDQLKKKLHVVCVSCWTFDSKNQTETDESFLMWKCYGGIDSVRISTTIGKLINSIKELPYDMLISDVIYDLNKWHPFNNFLFKKSIYYEDEHELRMVFLSRGENHLSFKVDMLNLIDEIRTSPFIDPIEEKMVISFLKERYPKLKNKIWPSLVMEYPL